MIKVQRGKDANGKSRWIAKIEPDEIVMNRIYQRDAARVSGKRVADRGIKRTFIVRRIDSFPIPLGVY